MDDLERKQKANRPIGIDDYVGTVGHEKHAIHKTHFEASGAQLMDTGFDTGFVWIRSKTGRQKLVKKEIANG